MVEPAAPLDEGTIIRKTSGGYHVQVRDQVLVCSLRSRLRKELDRPGESTDRSSGFGTRVVGAGSAHALSVGDRVRVTRAEEGVGAIEELLDRRSVFLRRSPGRRARNQVLVANLDAVLIVFSLDEPEFHPPALDRYLVAAESQQLETIICLNKLDLADPERAAALAGPYVALGYRVLLTSAVRGDRIDRLRELLAGRISALVGPSGTGKSSLANAIDPALDLRTGRLSRKYHKGAHVTTDVTLHRLGLPVGGEGFLVDTPGLRELGLVHLEPAELSGYFPEMEPLVGACKYGGRCLHRDEPGCVITEAVEAGTITAARYESYRRMLEYLEQQKDKW